MPSLRDRVHAEKTSANLSTAEEITLYEAASATTRAIGTGDVLELASIVITADTAMKVSVFADADDDNAIDTGELLFEAYLPANGQIAVAFPKDARPLGIAGGKPHAVASVSGNVTIMLEGFVSKAPIARGGTVGTPVHSP